MMILFVVLSFVMVFILIWQQIQHKKLVREIDYITSRLDTISVISENGFVLIPTDNDSIKKLSAALNKLLPNMDTNGNNHCDYMYGAVSVVIYYWHDQKICSCNNRYFFDCYCVTASYYHQKHNQSGVHNASYLSCYCYRHCYTTYL